MPISLYSLSIFVHVLGALGFFIAIGLEWFMLQNLQRSATSERATEWLKMNRGIQILSGISLVLILAAGAYMTVVAWSRSPWIEVAFAATILQGAIAGILTGQRLRAIRKTIAAEGPGPVTPALQAQLNHPLIRFSMLSRVGIAVGIIFLMTVKPALMVSVIALGTSLVVGALLSLVMMNSRAPQRSVA